MSQSKKTLAFLIISLFLFNCGNDDEEKKQQQNTNILLLGALAQRQQAASSPSLSYESSNLETGRAFTLNPNVSNISNPGTYSLASGGTLPSGLTLSSTTGVISGTASSTSSKTTYTVNTTSGNNATFTLRVVSSLSSITCNSSGISSGCTSSQPFSCTNTSICYRDYSTCKSNSSCDNL